MAHHVSLWTASAGLPVRPALAASHSVDVCIIGAGIAGLTTAYELVRSGKSVVVLDDGPVAGGMTQMSTGHLTNMLDDRYFELERLHGVAAARLAAESHTAAIDRVEAIVAREGIDCDFTRLDGYLFLAQGDQRDTLEKELAAAHRAGLARVCLEERAPYTSFNSGPCLRFPQVAQFHPTRYLAGLARAIERLGGRIFAETHAQSLEPGTPARVLAGRHAVTADAVVVATNVPINDRLAIHTKQAPYMTYVIAARVPRGSVPQVLAWDTGDPYYYLRLQSFGADDLLIVGGEDHKSGQGGGEERHARLETWARRRFPMMREVEFCWGGQIMETIDYLAFIGRNPGEENVYVATGDSGMGLTHGTIAGMLITDLVKGHDNRWAALYDPARKPLRAAREFARENLNVARQYADYLTPGDVGSAEEIAPGDGAVVRRGLKKLAVYKDAQGTVHERSAVCPHLGCIVQWNGAEKTWDCPCHGSRFDCQGKVINGPANRDLAATTEEQRAA